MSDDKKVLTFQVPEELRRQARIKSAKTETGEIGTAYIVAQTA